MKILTHAKKLSVGVCFEILRRGFHGGYCPICEKSTVFFKRGPWLRDHYHCIRCMSIPRQRALTHILMGIYPKWRELKIHESSPNGATFDKFSSQCLNYVASQFFPGIPSGSIRAGFRCEDLANQTFDDESFDIVITQDVLEHLLDPVKSLKEICRTLRPGGVHIFTVPWYHWQETKIRARRGSNEIEYIETPDYHGNPISDKGSLVVTEWGSDLIDTIYAVSGMSTTAIRMVDKRLGVDAKFIEVFLSKKLTLGTDLAADRWNGKGGSSMKNSS